MRASALDLPGFACCVWALPITDHNKLEFNFTDECWIEVFDAVGDQVYGDLNRTGDTLVVVGTAPFRVLFGKAPAAQLVFNGQRVSLDRYTRADLTATIKLPR